MRVPLQEMATEKKLELLPGGARNEAAGGEPAQNSASPGGSDASRHESAREEISPEVLEALAVDAPLLPQKRPLGARLADYFGRHQLLLFLLSFLALWGLVTLPPFLTRPDTGPGQLATRDYVAPQTTYVPDREETALRREAAAALVTPAYIPNPSALALALSELPSVVERTRAGLRASRPNGAEISEFRERAGWAPSPRLLAAMRSLSAEGWRRVGEAAREAVRAAYLRGRVRSDVSSDAATLQLHFRRAVEVTARRTGLSPQERAIAVALAAQAANYPNLVVDERATEQARRAARDAVLPVFQRVEANTPLVREGERITTSQWEQLQALELVAPDFAPLQALALGAFCFLLVSGGAFYLAFARREVMARPTGLWLVAFVPFAFGMAFRLLMGVPGAELLIIPLAATASMLITVLLDLRLGLPVGFVVASLCALMARCDAATFLAAALAAWIGALSVASLPSRFALFRAAVVLAITSAALAGALGVLRESPVPEIASTMLWNALAGGLAVGAMAGGAILLERPFGITSHLRLLELLSPDEAVLRRMQVEAPGTYTHSTLVASLAEAAAKTIGADSLLCRVAGTYHDIGKLRRPGCFIENQAGENVHDRLSPGTSALLIKAHVRDGLKLGRAIRLPEPVLEIIASHHGTTLISYFFHRAQKNGDGESQVDENLFRYPGPRPRSKEAAIVMLADSIEASARSLGRVTPEIIENHVHAIIETRLGEGELSDCELSLREIALVRESFVTTLRAALHGRIAYPDAASLREDDDWVAQTLGHASERPGPRASAPRASAPNAKESSPSEARPRRRVRRRGGRPQSDDAQEWMPPQDAARG